MIVSSLFGSRSRMPSTSSRLRSRLPASRPSCSTSWSSGGRMPCSREAVAEVRSLMPSSEAPMASRSSAKPADSRRSWMTRSRQLRAAVVDRGQHLLHVLQHPADDLVAVGEGVGQRGGTGHEALHGAALALQRLHDLERRLVDRLRVERLEQRPEAVEQHGQVQRVAGLRERQRAALGQRVGGAGALRQRDVPLADDVAVAQPGDGALRDLAVVVEGELDLGEAAVGDGQLLHLADADAGDADLVAGQQPGDVAEDGGVALLPAEADAPDGRRQGERQERRHDHEDDQLDEGGRGLHDSPTSVPRAMGPNSR